MCPQGYDHFDHVGAATQAQATHEAEIEQLRESLERIACQNALHDARNELHSLERSFARAIDAQGQAERARDDALETCQRLRAELSTHRCPRELPAQAPHIPSELLEEPK